MTIQFSLITDTQTGQLPALASKHALRWSTRCSADGDVVEVDISGVADIVFVSDGVVACVQAQAIHLVAPGAPTRSRRQADLTNPGAVDIDAESACFSATIGVAQGHFAC